MFSRLAAFVVRFPRLILLGWAALLLLALPLAGRVGNVLTSDVGLPPNSEGSAVRSTILREFAGSNYQVVLVARAPQNGEGDYGKLFQDALAEVAALPIVNEVLDSDTQSTLPLPQLANNPSSAALITLTSRDQPEVEVASNRIRALLPKYERDGLELILTGNIPVEQEVSAISARDSRRAEIFGLPISLVVLGVAFGALVAAALPLGVALVSVTLSLAVLYGFGHLFTMATFAQIVVTMLGLATGIDYALLMVNRFREELPRVQNPAEAARNTVLTAGRAITFSGLTVLIALAALLVPPLSFVRSIGVASIVVMLFSVLVSLTALPAALLLLGKRVNAIPLTRLIPGRRSRAFWERQSRRVTAHPLLFTVLGVALLVLLALPLLRIEVAFSSVRGLTAQTDTRKAQAVLEDLGLDSLLRSFDVLVDFGERGFYHPSSVRSVSSFTRAATELPKVAQALTPTTTGDVPSLFISGYYATQETAAESPLADLVANTISRDGRYALLRIFPESVITPSASARLENELRQLALDEDMDVLIGGTPVIEREWSTTLYSSFPLAVGLVYLITFILLGLAFRSLLIPLKSIILNTLTVAAAFGVITAVFQFGWGAHLFNLPGGLGFVESSVPIFIFAIVFGLSMDYEVFLVSRIVEHHDEGQNDHDAVVGAVAATGGVITSAALIMGVVFAVFLFSHVVLIKTLALGLTLAVLLDATLVRLVLVPAAMMLLGRWNWWLPGPIARLARRVHIGHD